MTAALLFGEGLTLLQRCGAWGPALGFLLWGASALALLRLLQVVRHGRDRRALESRLREAAGAARDIAAEIDAGVIRSPAALRLCETEYDRLDLAALFQFAQGGGPSSESTPTFQPAMAAGVERTERWLGVIAELSPLVGLAGTVGSYLLMLQQAAATGAGDFASLSAPASLAMTTTLAGLTPTAVSLCALGLLRPCATDSGVLHARQKAIAAARQLAARAAVPNPCVELGASIVEAAS